MSNLFSYTITALNWLTPNHLQLKISPEDQRMSYEAGQYVKIHYNYSPCPLSRAWSLLFAEDYIAGEGWGEGHLIEGVGRVVTIHFPQANVMPFSIANAPSLNHEIEIHIKVSPQEQETFDFVQSLSIKSRIFLSGPYGDCQIKINDNPMIILAAGTGFSPAKAIIEKLISTSPTRECHFYWTVKQMTDFYLPELPIMWQSQLKNFHYTLICTETESKSKLKILDAVAQDFETLSNQDIYVFGPPSLASDALTRFQKLGLKKNHFYTDA